MTTITELKAAAYVAYGAANDVKVGLEVDPTTVLNLIAEHEALTRYRHLPNDERQDELFAAHDAAEGTK